VNSVSSVTWLGIPVLVAVFSFGAFAGSGGHLSPRVVFTSLTLFNLLRFPLMMLPSLVSSITEALVSVRRIQAYLDAPELDKNAVTRLPRGPMPPQRAGDVLEEAAASQSKRSSGDFVLAVDPSAVAAAAAAAAAREDGKSLSPTVCVSLPAAPMSWKSPLPAGIGKTTPPPSGTCSTHAPLPTSSVSSDGFKLGPISLDIPAGALVAVVGASGSGKSALLCAMLGEMYREGGSVFTSKETLFSYAPQSPFIKNATVTENIVFGAGA